MLTRRQRTAALGAGIVSVFMCGSGISEVAAARPVRGPLLGPNDAARAQAVLERELGRPLPAAARQRIAARGASRPVLRHRLRSEPETASPHPAPTLRRQCPGRGRGRRRDQRPPRRLDFRRRAGGVRGSRGGSPPVAGMPSRETIRPPMARSACSSATGSLRTRSRGPISRPSRSCFPPDPPPDRRRARAGRGLERRPRWRRRLPSRRCARA